MDDFYSLVRYLRLEPLSHRDWWTRLIMRPLKDKFRLAEGFVRLQVPSRFRLLPLMVVLSLRVCAIH